MNSFEQVKQRLSEITTWLEKEYASIHTGAASPAILDTITVEVYGAQQPIKNIASLTVEDPKTLRVAPWDSSNIGPIEKSITSADLGLSVAVDSSGLRVIFPQLTEETRAKIAKALKTKLEDARVSVRKEREEMNDQFDKQNKAGEMSDDEKFQKKEQLQKMIDEANKKLEEIYQTKEDKVMKV